MTCVVISQPFLFPWVGMFEQIALADVYVHYDDVQFSKGSFVNRVQVKTPDGFKWMTVPLASNQLGLKINELMPQEEKGPEKNWRHQHLELLRQHYRGAPCYSDMMDLITPLYAAPPETLCGFLMEALEAVCRYYGLDEGTRFYKSSDLGIGGKSSQRVFDIVRHFGGTDYVTGHGARNYLDHTLFEDHGIRVAYMDYQKTPYPQQYGTFNPYVSILDLMANTGSAGGSVIHSGTKYWREFLS